MSSSDPASAKAQARILLQALCKFFLPAIQTVVRGNTINVEQISSGAEADELVVELEKIISGTQPRAKEFATEVTLEKPAPAGYHLGAVFHQLNNTTESIIEPVSKKLAPMGYHLGAILSQQNSPHVVGRSLVDPEKEKKVSEELQKLRVNINQRMPIRLLCFEPQTGSSKLKISLLDKNQIYDYLSPKVRADIYNGRSKDSAEYTEYAILSHTWTQTPGEFTYGDWQKGLFDDTNPKCQKLINFCNAAWKDHGLTFGWIDTVCINKESSPELDESLRSMYAWYARGFCITYLAETNTLPDMHKDPWFTRGWTLQELIAPEKFKFYNKNWKQLSDGASSATDKNDPLIQQEITLATTITPEELLPYHIQKVSISRRMQLAAKRQVTREEDIAYCLMGIFDVGISSAYGEGAERAFFRLIEEIFRTTKDVSDVFNWAGDRNRLGSSRPPVTSLFPFRPSNYLDRSSNEKLHPWRPIEPLTLTHLGLRTPILLMPAVPIRDSVGNCQPIGNYFATVSVDPFSGDSMEPPKNYHLLDKRFSGPEGEHHIAVGTWYRAVNPIFGILNVEEYETSIHVPKTCLAVLLFLTPRGQYGVFETTDEYERVYTAKPIVFNLRTNPITGNSSDDGIGKVFSGSHSMTGGVDYYWLGRSELAKHGMKLVTLYL